MNHFCIENEVVPYFTLRTNTENFAQLLKTCFLKQNISPATRMVRWNAQGGNNMILNVDGRSTIGNPGISGFGGLIRNSDGAWVHDFAGNIGFSNILHAELLAVYHGLTLAWELDIKDLWCYSDSKIVIKLLSDHVNDWHCYAAIIYNIKDLLARDWRVRVMHTLREGNACADYLAKIGARNLEAYSPIVVPPDGMNLLLLADASGTLFFRYFLLLSFSFFFLLSPEKKKAIVPCMVFFLLKQLSRIIFV
jgi:ribonuclease HI